MIEPHDKEKLCSGWKIYVQNVFNREEYLKDEFGTLKKRVKPACLPTDQVPALIATSVYAWGGAVSGGLTRIISCQCSQPGTLHFGTYSKVRYQPSGNANTCPGSPWSLQGPLPPSTSADQVPSCTCLLNDFSTPSILASIETSYQSSSRMR